MKKKILRIAIITIILVTQLTILAYAAGGNPIVKFSNWTMQGIQSLFLVAVAAIGLYVLIKRKILAALVLLLVAGIGALFVFGGADVFIKISDIIKQWL